MLKNKKNYESNIFFMVFLFSLFYITKKKTVCYSCFLEEKKQLGHMQNFYFKFLEIINLFFLGSDAEFLFSLFYITKKKQFVILVF